MFKYWRFLRQDILSTVKPKVPQPRIVNDLRILLALGLLICIVLMTFELLNTDGVRTCLLLSDSAFLNFNITSELN